MKESDSRSVKAALFQKTVGQLWELDSEIKEVTNSGNKAVIRNGESAMEHSETVKAKNHFQRTIWPLCKDEFVGVLDDEKHVVSPAVLKHYILDEEQSQRCVSAEHICVEAVFKDIRKEILKRLEVYYEERINSLSLRHSAVANPMFGLSSTNDSELERLRYAQQFIDQYKQKLIEGGPDNDLFFQQAAQIFTSNIIIEEIALRSFNPYCSWTTWAPLMIPPADKDLGKGSEFGERRKKMGSSNFPQCNDQSDMIVHKIRRMAAVMWLANKGNKDAVALCLGTLADIKRAHNNDINDLVRPDDHACPAGTTTRLVFKMGELHPKLKVINIEFEAEKKVHRYMMFELDKLLIGLTSFKEKEQFVNALCELTFANRGSLVALNNLTGTVIAGMGLREQFIAQFYPEWVFERLFRSQQNSNMDSHFEYVRLLRGVSKQAFIARVVKKALFDFGSAKAEQIHHVFEQSLTLDEKAQYDQRGAREEKAAEDAIQRQHVVQRQTFLLELGLERPQPGDREAQIFLEQAQASWATYRGLIKRDKRTQKQFYNRIFKQVARALLGDRVDDGPRLEAETERVKTKLQPWLSSPVSIVGLGTIAEDIQAQESNEYAEEQQKQAGIIYQQQLMAAKAREERIRQAVESGQSIWKTLFNPKDGEYKHDAADVQATAEAQVLMRRFTAPSTIWDSLNKQTINLGSEQALVLENDVLVGCLQEDPDTTCQHELKTGLGCLLELFRGSDHECSEQNGMNLPMMGRIMRASLRDISAYEQDLRKVSLQDILLEQLTLNQIQFKNSIPEVDVTLSCSAGPGSYDFNQVDSACCEYIYKLDSEHSQPMFIVVVDTGAGENYIASTYFFRAGHNSMKILNRYYDDSEEAHSTGSYLTQSCPEPYDADIVLPDGQDSVYRSVFEVAPSGERDSDDSDDDFDPTNESRGSAQPDSMPSAYVQNLDSGTRVSTHGREGRTFVAKEVRNQAIRNLRQHSENTAQQVRKARCILIVQPLQRNGSTYETDGSASVLMHSMIVVNDTRFMKDTENGDKLARIKIMMQGKLNDDEKLLTGYQQQKSDQLEEGLSRLEKIFTEAEPSVLELSPAPPSLIYRSLEAFIDGPYFSVEVLLKFKKDALGINLIHWLCSKPSNLGEGEASQLLNKLMEYLQKKVISYRYELQEFLSIPNPMTGLPPLVAMVAAGFDHKVLPAYFDAGGLVDIATSESIGRSEDSETFSDEIRMPAGLTPLMCIFYCKGEIKNKRKQLDILLNNNPGLVATTPDDKTVLYHAVQFCLKTKADPESVSLLRKLYLNHCKTRTQVQLENRVACTQLLCHVIDNYDKYQGKVRWLRDIRVLLAIGAEVHAKVDVETDRERVEMTPCLWSIKSNPNAFTTLYGEIDDFSGYSMPWKKTYKDHLCIARYKAEHEESVPCLEQQLKDLEHVYLEQCSRAEELEQKEINLNASSHESSQRFHGRDLCSNTIDTSRYSISRSYSSLRQHNSFSCHTDNGQSESQDRFNWLSVNPSISERDSFSSHDTTYGSGLRPCTSSAAIHNNISLSPVLYSGGGNSTLFAFPDDRRSESEGHSYWPSPNSARL